ncbi:phosphotransferase family protein [Actinocorallia longicatena]|uniref:Aminoglycoside phosphotransferase domain-containing protein n=1 Tax=Actinocorallia longicatena TaxID=111803 RepID=A0ABP6QF57_9ACTN
MLRTAWTDLPANVRTAVREQTGHVLEEAPTRFGARAALTSTLTTKSGPVFVKAAQAGSPFLAGLRTEQAVNPHVKHLAAPLLWTVETDGWLVLGFEHAAGTHQFYEPGSAALAALTRLLHDLADLLCPGVVTKPVGAKWAGGDGLLTEAMDGDALLHTDLNPANLLLAGDGRAVAVDWAWASRGAPWVEIALLIPRLISYGHTAEQAEQWATQFPAWRQAPGTALDAFATENLRRWQEAKTGDPAWLAEMADSAQQWILHRRQR